MRLCTPICSAVIDGYASGSARPGADPSVVAPAFLRAENGTPSTEIIGPASSGAAAATHIASKPPILWPTITGWSSFLERM